MSYPKGGDEGSEGVGASRRASAVCWVACCRRGPLKNMCSWLVKQSRWGADSSSQLARRAPALQVTS